MYGLTESTSFNALIAANLVILQNNVKTKYPCINSTNSVFKVQSSSHSSLSPHCQLAKYEISKIVSITDFSYRFPT